MMNLGDKLSGVMTMLRSCADEPSWETVEAAILEAARVATAHERARNCAPSLIAEREACVKIVENAQKTRWKNIDQALLYIIRMVRLRNKQ